MKIQIVICTHNNEDIIERCLHSITELATMPSWNITILVVDDASTDKTVNKVNALGIEVHKFEKNIGPSACRNVVFSSLYSYDYYLFLDSDVILDKNCLLELMGGMGGMTGITGPKLLLPDGKINSAGGGLTKSGFGFDIGYGNEDSILFDAPSDCMYICSAVMLLSRGVLGAVGYFDPAYFYGHEDTDYGWRANLMYFKVGYIPKAKAVHYKSSSVSKDMGLIYFHATKNRLSSIIKNYNIFNMAIYGSMYAIISMGDLIFMPYRLQKIKAWLWSIKHLPDTLKKRKDIQSRRLLRDYELPFDGVLPR